MLCSLMSVMLCSVVLCSAQFCHVRRRGGGRDIPGHSGQLGVWRPRCAGWGWPGGLFLKSNNPNLSGGEKQLCYVMPCYVMPCYVVLCSVMRCSVVLSCSALSCHVVSCYVLSCFVMLCSVMLCSVMPCRVMLCHAMLCHALFCHALLRSVPFVEGEGADHQGFSLVLGVWRPRYAGRAGREVCS